MRRAILGLGLVALTSATGCQLIFGAGDYVVDDGTGGTGGTGTTTATGGTAASGGTATTGGSGGTGGTGAAMPFGCFPVGTDFEVLGEADIPGADETSEFFIIPEPASDPPTAHVATRLDTPTGTLVARTIKGFNALGDTTTWSPPPGASRYVDGYAASDEVVVLGRITGATGTTVAEIHLPKSMDDEIDPGAQAQAIEIERPFDCPAPEATIQALSFARASGATSYAATWDECASGTRRLYWSSQSGPQLVREGAPSDPELALSNYARVGNSYFFGFFDGSSAGYSFGTSVQEINGYKPVVLGPSGSTLTAPLAAVAVSASALGVFWQVYTVGTIVPVDLLGRIVASNKLATVDEPGSYTQLTQYSDPAKVTNFRQPSVGPSTIVLGGPDLDGSAARFSVFSTAGEPLDLEREAASGGSKSIGSVAAAHFGPSKVVVAWQSINNSVLTVRARIFDCK